MGSGVGAEGRGRFSLVQTLQVFSKGEMSSCIAYIIKIVFKSSLGELVFYGRHNQLPQTQ